MRYSSSAVSAIIISFFTFLGMSMLVSSPKYKPSTKAPEVNFTLIKPNEAPKVKPATNKRKPLPKQKTKQQPPRPQISVTEAVSREDIHLPNSIANKNDPSLMQLDIPKNPLSENDAGQGDGEIRTLFSFQPMYPAEAARNKIEGWVKVEFVVNELGRVSHAKIIDSKPKRVFDSSTLRALYKSKFQPKKINGKAVSQTAVQIIEFKLE